MEKEKEPDGILNSKEACFQTHIMDNNILKRGGFLPLDKKSKDGRAAFARLLLNSSTKEILNEYRDNKNYNPEKFSTTTFSKNMVKNRYGNIFCREETRVILKNDHYIHANWALIPNSMQQFICTQGPLEDTAEDFWRMVLQERSQVVVMLCDFYENGDPKCYQYFPPAAGTSVKFGQFQILNLKECECNIQSVKWTILELSYGKQKVLINSFRYHSWPDHLAPLHPGIVIDLLHLAKSKSDVRPIVVHCSAGIGRTGTFVGLEYANERLKSNDKLGLVDIMKELRKYRLQAIQAPVQYLFLAVCLLETFARQNLIERDSNFETFLSNYISYVNRQAAKHGIKTDAK